MAIKQISVSESTTPRYLLLNNELNTPVGGQIQLSKDKEAVYSYFIDYVHKKLRHFGDLEEKIEYLVSEEYIKKELIDKYDFKFIKDLFKSVYGVKHRFKSFMGAYKFYSQYAMRDKDGVMLLESYEDRVVFNALEMGDGDEVLASLIADEIIHQRLQPATPSFLNAGRVRGGEKVSCFLISPSDDMNSIGRSINSALQLSKIGGGVGVNLTDIRPSGDPIKGIKGLTSGVVPVMKLFEDSFSYSNQMGTRAGAGAMYLNIFHKDIVRFLSTKKENADEKIRVKTLSLGLIVPDKFYELIAENKTMYLFSPYDINKEYGKLMSEIDITEMYDELVSNPNIHKDKVNARELEDEISKLIQESGYPYILNIDTANRSNPVYGKIKMSNLCSEILQVQESSIIGDNQEYEKLGTDISCNLSSTNISNMMKSPDFGTSVRIATRALTYVSDSSNIEVVPTIKNGNDKYHSIGLGAMDAHNFLATNKIEYGSEDSIQFIGMYFQLLNYWTLFESNDIAKERKTKFYQFEKSEYANGEYFNKYKKHIRYREDLSDVVKDLFKDIFIPTDNDWKELEESIKKYGLYSSNRLAVAPTGSISYINEATASIHPIVQKIEKRSEKKRGDIFYPAPNLSDETIPYYKSAYDIDQRKLIDFYAEAQKHVDQGISMTLFLKSDGGQELYEWKDGTELANKVTTRDINILRNYAWTKDIKTIYYVRTFTADGTTSSVNECESCSI